MPYYASRLKASSLPQDATLDLEAMTSEPQNPHLLPLPKLIARLVRENSAKWVFDNLNESYFPDNATRTTLGQRGTSPLPFARCIRPRSSFFAHLLFVSPVNNLTIFLYLSLFEAGTN